MAKVHVEQELPASADKVWSVIQDFSDMSAWANADMSLSRSEGSGKGALRWIETAQGQMVERCETHDPAARSFSYSVTAGPESLERYLATVALQPQGDERCFITWSCDFVLKGVPEADAVRLMESTYRDGFIANLSRYLAGAAR